MNLQEQISRIKQVMNLNEDENRLNQILDKINAKGMDSLNNREKTFLYSLNKTNVSQESENYDSKIVVVYNKNYNPQMVKKIIERLFNNVGIKSEVNHIFMGLGIGIGYEIRLNNYFLYEDEIHDFLTKNGFKIIEGGLINNDTEIPQDVVKKVQKYTQNYDVLVSPNHGHELTDSQEMSRIKKILNRNNITNYFMGGDDGSIKLTLTKSSQEEKDKIYIILSNSGYDINRVL